MRRRSKLSLSEMILFWNYLKHFLGAGLPLIFAFQRLTRILKGKAWTVVLQKIEFGLLSGKTFSQALEESKENFDREVIEMIAIGEKRGNYPEIIGLIVDHLKWQLDTKKSVKNALRYPLILIIILGVIFYLILHHIVPQLSSYLGAMGKRDLPFSTHLLLAMSQIAPFVLGILGGMGIVVFVGLKGTGPFFSKTRRLIEKYVLKLPIIGPLYDRFIVISFIRMLALLLESGVDILVSLHHSIKIISNSFVVEQLEKAKHQLIQGEKLSFAVKEVFSHHPALLLLVDLGEQTGNLPHILHEHARFEMAQFQNDVAHRIQALQPFLILIMGGLLIWVVLAILLPMYDQIGQGGGL